MIIFIKRTILFGLSQSMRLKSSVCQNTTENIVIETVPTAYNKLFCYRDFNVYGESGDKIMTIHSTFVLMDYDSRKVHPVIDEIVDVYDVEKIKKIDLFVVLVTKAWKFRERNDLSRSLF